MPALVRIMMTVILALAGMQTGVYAKSSTADPDPEETVARAVMDDPDMIWGIGTADDRAEAVDKALANLAGKLSVTVDVATESSSHESLGADGTLSSTSDFSSIVRSYANPAALRDVRQIWTSNTAPYEVVAYITRRQMENMYQRRRDNVAEFARMGMTAERDGRIDDALRYLYRAFVVLRSLPEYQDIHEVVDGRSRHLVTWIPEQMRAICSRISFGIAAVNPADASDPSAGQLLDLNVRYKGEGVSRVGFTYFTGRSKSPVITARDGMAEVSLAPNTPLDNFTLDIEYRYADENHLIEEYAPLLEAYNGAGLVPSARIPLTQRAKDLKADKKESKAFNLAASAGAHTNITPVAKSEMPGYVAVMSELVGAINARDYDAAEHLFTPEGAEMFRKLIHYGKARIVGKSTPDTYSFFPVGDRVVCRSIPMSFTFEEGRRQFLEDVTFTFNSDGLIESLAFSLDSKARDDIFAMDGAAWNDYVKMVIVGFLENYKTAFALHRLDYIRSIFADDAVIIIGHVTRKAQLKRGEMRGLANQEHITYVRKNKEEYMNSLEKCFNSNQYINIRFGATEVGKSAYGPSTYGIQLRQEYTSSSYGDTGYLYLLVDFESSDEPMIHVRTWQPERNPDLTPHLPKESPQYGIFSNSYWD